MEGITERMPAHFSDERQRFWKRWIPTLLAIVILTTVFCCEGLIVRHNTTVKLRAEYEAEYAARLEAYKAEQARATQAEHWLSGEASKEAAINRAIDAVAPVIAKLGTDRQKLTEACCILARVMSANFPNSFEEVAAQPDQWMFFNGSDATYSEHDRELAETIVRPYMQNGIVPDGLTSLHVYGEWSTNDYVLRNTWEKTSRTDYWRMPE